MQCSMHLDHLDILHTKKQETSYSVNQWMDFSYSVEMQLKAPQKASKWPLNHFVKLLLPK